MNDDEQHEIDPELARVLGASAPIDSLAARADEQVIHAMAMAAKREATPERPPRSTRRTAGIALVLGLGLGGVGAAAAAVTHQQWSPWAQDPDVVFTYMLPSGATCEQRIGDVAGPDTEAIEATRAFFRTHDVLALADVEGAIAWLRTDEHTITNDDGTSRAANYGRDDYMSPDTEYQVALAHAVSALIEDELSGQGLVGDGDTYASEAYCPGAQW